MTSPFHEGELEVQARAGVAEMSRRVGRGIRAEIPPAAREFLRDQRAAFLGTVDGGGRVWASALAGEPGFMRAVDERTVEIEARPAAGDPLGENLVEPSDAALLAIEFETRRRMRLNGTAERRGGVISLRARQVYSNCPKYIHPRAAAAAGAGPPRPAVRGGTLTPRQREWIEAADTFFVASHHREGGADVSHRGGAPGFVRVVGDRTLVWPDYAGNMMFQTLGNIAVDPRAGLLFVDFARGDTLQLTGRARIVWDAARLVGMPGAERAVELEVDEVVEIGGAIPLRWGRP
jgi:predicted pyridoxine 5'-phosphate oxidase superfamily flavin-nucleotide-binding protein